MTGAPGTFWYVSKYVALPGPGNPIGSRGFRLMAELAKLGHTCVIVTSDSNHLADVATSAERYASTVIEGVRVVTVRTLQAEQARSSRRIASWVDFEWRLARMPIADLPRPDAIVVSSLSLFTIFNGAVWRRRTDAALVFEIRDIWPLTLTEEGGFSPNNPVIKALGAIERWGYRTSDAIVGTMPNLGEHVSEVLGRASPVACIPMGVMPQQVRSGVAPARSGGQSPPDDRFIVTYAGTMGITNALDTLLRCAALANDAGVAGLHFQFLGEGGRKEQAVHDYGHLPNVSFLPHVPRDQVADILAASDALFLSVHESRVWQYGQSLNKLIDYMAAGRPIVASYTGFPSMIDESGCGVIVPAGDSAALLDAICTIRDMDPAQREAMGANGRDWLVANRQYATLAQQYQRVLEAATAARQVSREPQFVAGGAR